MATTAMVSSMASIISEPVTSLAMIECGLDIFLEADMAKIRTKSIKLCDLFIELVEGRCGEFGFSLNSPREGAHRGSQVSFNHKNGYPIIKALIDRGVIGDFRAPDNMRFGFAPLYIKYVDIWDAVEHLEDIMSSNVWQKNIYNQAETVT